MNPLFEGEAELANFGATRWMKRTDGSVLAIRPPHGIVALSSDEVGTDAGHVVAPFSDVDAWDEDADGLSIAEPMGFHECRWSDGTCISLGPRFGTGDYPESKQRIIAFMRREGHTLFSLAPAAVPYCEARPEVQSCSSIQLGGIVALDGSNAYAASTISDETGAQQVVRMTWSSDAGWVEVPGGFMGPPGYFIVAGLRAITPSRVIFSRGDQVLFLQWDASDEIFEYVDVDGGSIDATAAGASPGYFWVSTKTPTPLTLVYFE